MKSIFSKILAFMGLMMFSTFIYAQNAKTVTGTITDNGGIPLPGVNIYIEGTTIGKISDTDGKYQISVPNADKAVLVYSFIGFVEQKIQVAGKSTINIVLEEQTIGLDEVVAIGYGTVKKRDLTGAVSSVKTEELKQAPVANVAQAMQGKLAGVVVSSQDGRPGADVKIRIRGGGSITQSNDPLVVVDGVPGGTLSDIPADQIATIDILKDAASTAIYGARGANGVILITTKGSSIKEGKTKVSYSGYTQFKNISNRLEALNSQDYLLFQWSYMTAYQASAGQQFAEYFGLGSANTNSYGHSGIDAWNDYAAIKSHNYTDDLIRNAMSKEHNISLSSATDKTSIYFGANMSDDEGIKIKSGYRRYNANLKIDHKLYKNAKIGFNISYVNTRREGNESTSNGVGSILSSAYTFSPIDDPLGHGSIPEAPAFGDGSSNIDEAYNPYQKTIDIEDISNNEKFRGLVYLDLEIIKGLTFRSEISGSKSYNESQRYDAGRNLPNIDNIIMDRSARLNLKRGYGYRVANTLNYEIQGLGDSHKVSVLAGNEISQSNSTSSKIEMQGYPADYDFETTMGRIQNGVYYIPQTYFKANGDSVSVDVINKPYFDFNNNIGVAKTTVSYFGRLNYSYKGRYLVTATLRADASSKFAPENSWGYFPAAALAWRISDEPFMAGNSWLDNLKLRASIGTAGMDNIPYYAWNDLYDTSFASNGDKISESKGYYPSPNLKWETTISRNLGLDYGIFNNHIYGSLEVYWNNTKDLLGEIPVAPESGFSTQFQNVGSTSNRGVELSLAADIVRQKDFSVSVNATYNYNKNKIDELSPSAINHYGSDWMSNSTRPSSDYIFKVDVPIGTVRGYESDGFYTLDDFNYINGVYTLKEKVPYYGATVPSGAYPNPFKVGAGMVINQEGENISANIFPGALKIKDTSGDGKIDENDITELGQVTPLHTGGFGLNLYYKGIDFNANLTYALGGHVYNVSKLLSLTGRKQDGFGANKLDFIKDAYKVYDIDESGDLYAVTDPAGLRALNANAKYHLPYAENGVVLSDFFEKSDYLRLNTLTLGYTLPKSISQKVAIQRLRIYVTGGNLFTLTNYSGLDPEVSSEDDKGVYATPGLDFGTYPRSRTFTFGVNIDF